MHLTESGSNMAGLMQLGAKWREIEWELTNLNIFSVDFPKTNKCC